MAYHGGVSNKRIEKAMVMAASSNGKWRDNEMASQQYRRHGGGVIKWRRIGGIICMILMYRNQAIMASIMA